MNLENAKIPELQEEYERTIQFLTSKKESPDAKKTRVQMFLQKLRKSAEAAAPNHYPISSNLEFLDDVLNGLEYLMIQCEKHAKENIKKVKFYKGCAQIFNGMRIGALGGMALTGEIQGIVISETAVLGLRLSERVGETNASKESASVSLLNIFASILYPGFVIGFTIIHRDAPMIIGNTFNIAGRVGKECASKSIRECNQNIYEDHIQLYELELLYRVVDSISEEEKQKVLK